MNNKEIRNGFGDNTDAVVKVETSQNAIRSQQAAAYVRSAVDDAGQLATRKAATLELAESHGLQIPDSNVYAERGSGNASGPGLTELIERIRSGEITTLVTINPDRLFRDSSSPVARQVTATLKQNELEVITKAGVHHFRRL